MTLRHSNRSQSGTTVVETMVAVLIIAGFFGAFFEVNAVCLHYINASKDSVAALQGAQNRLECLRGLVFTDLTNSTYLQNLMVTPADVPPGCALPACDPSLYSSDFVRNQVTEVVTLSAYPTAATNTQITRGPGASVTPTINSTDANLANANLVKVNVNFTWKARVGGTWDPALGYFKKSEQTETIISAGNKK
jgi:hypothetical protein